MNFTRSNRRALSKREKPPVESEKERHITRPKETHGQELIATGDCKRFRAITPTLLPALKGISNGLFWGKLPSEPNQRPQHTLAQTSLISAHTHTLVLTFTRGNTHFNRNYPGYHRAISIKERFTQNSGNKSSKPDQSTVRFDSFCPDVTANRFPDGQVALRQPGTLDLGDSVVLFDLD